jgi:hypothetical protein
MNHFHEAVKTFRKITKGFKTSRCPITKRTMLIGTLTEPSDHWLTTMAMDASKAGMTYRLQGNNSKINLILYV